MSSEGDERSNPNAVLSARGETSEQFQDAATRVADGTLEEFRAHAAQNLWESRIGRGYRKCGKHNAAFAFGYVHEVYGDWIERGVRSGNPLTLEDIRVVDRPLFRRVHQEIERKGATPDWLYLPLTRDAAAPLSVEEHLAKLASVPSDFQLRQPPRKPSRYIEQLRAKYGE